MENEMKKPIGEVLSIRNTGNGGVGWSTYEIEIRGYDPCGGSGSIILFYDPSKNSLYNKGSVGPNNTYLTGHNVEHAELPKTLELRLARILNGRESKPVRFTIGSSAAKSDGEIEAQLTFSSKNAEKELKVFPNPSSESVQIILPEPHMQLQLFNMQGNLIKDYVTDDQNFQVNIADLPAGLYLFKAQTGMQTWVAKVVVE
nr:T9SS type A sorting domain-containing protein [Flavilitoribacter nigricans]